jgi:hypothetical protein
VLGRAAKDLETIWWRVWRKKVGNCPHGAPRSPQELDRPLCYATLGDVLVAARFNFLDVLLLDDQCEWLLGARCGCRERARLGACGKRPEIVIAVVEVESTSLGMAPHAVFENRVPDVPATGLRGC